MDCRFPSFQNNIRRTILSLLACWIPNHNNLKPLALPFLLIRSKSYISHLKYCKQLSCLIPKKFLLSLLARSLSSLPIPSKHYPSKQHCKSSEKKKSLLGNIHSRKPIRLEYHIRLTRSEE